MIDLHCHVLAGIDDGPATIEGSLEIARAAATAGTHTLVATPHVSLRYPNDAPTIARLVEELRARLIVEGITLDIRPGAEVAISRIGDVEPAQLFRFGLGGGEWLLVEPPFTHTIAGLDGILANLQQRGHRVLLAHPERCPGLRRDPRLLESLVRGGVLTSVTAGSLVGSFGEEIRRFALALARDGLLHNVVSDAHDHVNRPPGTADDLERAGLAPLADWLTEQVPAAILNGNEIPPRPEVSLPDLLKPQSSWWRRRIASRRAS